MKRFRKLYGGLLALLALGVSYPAVCYVLGPEVPVALVARRELVQKVVASGRVLPPARINIGSSLVTTVTRVLVEEGEDVQAGQLLLQLDDALEQASVSQARAGVLQAEAKLNHLHQVDSKVASESVRQSEVNLKQAEIKFRRVQVLFDKGVISQAELDEAQKHFDLARSQYQSATIRAASTAPRGSEYQFAVSALAQARATLATAEARLAQTKIIAPTSGTILNRMVEAGDIVQPGHALLVLSREGNTQIVFQPEEKNLSLLRVGQQAQVSADAFPNHIFQAQVSNIAPAVDSQRGTIEVKLSVPRPPSFLRPDMTVSVDVEVARQDHALVIPLEALKDVTTPQPWVLAVCDGRTERKIVQVGIRGAGQAEILDGLSEGQTVVLPEAKGICAGQRVRPQIINNQGLGKGEGHAAL